MSRAARQSAKMPALRRLLQEGNIRRLFRFSLTIKGIFALLEIVGGMLTFIVSQRYLVDFVIAITKEELTEDPRDLVARYLVESAQQLSITSQHFAGFYLLSHGIIKGVLIIGLLRNKLAYYPLAIAIFALFIAYQLFRFHVTHSLWLLAITALDVLIIGLTWHEYRYLRRHLS